MGRAAEVVAPSSSIRTDGGCPVVQVNDLSRSLTAFDPISTLVVVVEMSKTSWLDYRFRESCHKRGIHLSFQAPICAGALRTKD